MGSSDRTSQRQLHTWVEILSSFIALCTHLPNVFPKKIQPGRANCVQLWSGHLDTVIWFPTGWKADVRSKDGRKYQRRQHPLPPPEKKKKHVAMLLRCIGEGGHRGAPLWEQLSHNIDHSKSPNLWVPQQRHSPGCMSKQPDLDCGMICSSELLELTKTKANTARSLNCCWHWEQSWCLHSR